MKTVVCISRFFSVKKLVSPLKNNNCFVTLGEIKTQKQSRFFEEKPTNIMKETLSART